MLRGPLGLKYSCPSQSTWLLCHSTLLSVIEEGVDTACERGLHMIYVRIYELELTLEDLFEILSFIFSITNSNSRNFPASEFEGMWIELGKCLEEFLFGDQ